MKNLFYLLIIALFVGVAACGAEESQDAEPKKSASKKEKKVEYDGAKIYKKYCVSCHGIYGDMGTNGAKNLQESELTREERIEIVTKGKGVMTPWGGILNEGEIEAVADYTFELKKD